MRVRIATLAASALQRLRCADAAQMTLASVLLAVVFFAAGSVAWRSGHEWLAVAAAVGTFVCVSLPDLFDPHHKDSDTDDSS